MSWGVLILILLFYQTGETGLFIQFHWKAKEVHQPQDLLVGYTPPEMYSHFGHMNEKKVKKRLKYERRVSFCSEEEINQPLLEESFRILDACIVSSSLLY